MSSGRRLAAIAAAALCASASVLAGAALAGDRAQPRLTIFAAASLTNVFPRIDPREEYSFGGSNALAAQIEQGLPADVFASANTALAWQLHRKGLVTRPVDFTANTLVLITQAGNPHHLTGLASLRKPGLRISMGAAGVPVGDYTRIVLARLGLSSIVDGADQETDVREVLAKVALGEADVGFVYGTDAKTVQAQVKVFKIPARAQPNVVYAAAAVTSSKNLAAARAWVLRLRQAAAQRKLRAAGFLREPRAR
jgi:molybdate transport system substrate-binding protein